MSLLSCCSTRRDCTETTWVWSAALLGAGLFYTAAEPSHRPFNTASAFADRVTKHIPKAGGPAQLAKAAAADARGTPPRTGPTLPALPAGATAPNQGAVWPAANPEVALPRENTEVDAAAERRPGAAVPKAARGRETAADSAAAPNAAAEQGPSMALNAAVEQKMNTALGMAVAPEMAAAASIPVQSGPAETASCKEAAVQAAAQPGVVCAVCSGSSELSQSPPLRPPLFAPSISELPLPDDSSLGSEADEVLALGRKATVAARRRKRLFQSHPWTSQDCTVTAFWTADISDQRPQMTCTLVLPNACPPWTQLRGLIDTGADVTIISFSAWPPSWPLAPVGSAIAGLGGITQSYLSKQSVMVRDPEGHTATIRPYVTTTSLNLWGRNVLAAWGVRIWTNF
ncbi:mRNA decay activator protein ZFP36L3-like isoform X1 [Aphelocoma coerulescens]|uniref:mRNA decay activator protein ZFP36L3-like isoform X1 n=1 Tax=Aphelocoma coerulescens TaxID=39617 RepID=UPI0036045F2F